MSSYSQRLQKYKPTIFGEIVMVHIRDDIPNNIDENIIIGDKVVDFDEGNVISDLGLTLTTFENMPNLNKWMFCLYKEKGGIACEGYDFNESKVMLTKKDILRFLSELDGNSSLSKDEQEEVEYIKKEFQKKFTDLRKSKLWSRYYIFYNCYYRFDY